CLIPCFIHDGRMPLIDERTQLYLAAESRLSTTATALHRAFSAESQAISLVAPQSRSRSAHFLTPFHPSSWRSRTLAAPACGARQWHRTCEAERRRILTRARDTRRPDVGISHTGDQTNCP